MSDRIILALVVLAIALPIAFFIDRNSWRKRPRADLERMIQGDWRRIGAALKEIKRRGEDISPYVPCVLRLMIDESSLKRTAGKLTLADHFPDIARQIPKFEATGSREAREAILDPILRQYGVLKTA